MQAQNALSHGSEGSFWVEQWAVGTRTGEGERDREVAALFDEHFDGLCRLAYLIVGDAHLAEEIVMEALLKVFTGWGRIRDKSQSSAYLRRSVVNLCRSKIRRKVIEARVNAQHHHAEEIRPPRWDPERHETAREVWDAVRELPPRQRACIILHYEEDLPDAEIAEILDCSVTTVRSQLSRARDKLARMLKPEGTEGALG
jgi:RNA polymerase sigma-70 factor (sigma-E family)